jgi:hypothetical protein
MRIKNVTPAPVSYVRNLIRHTWSLWSKIFKSSEWPRVEQPGLYLGHRILIGSGIHPVSYLVGTLGSFMVIVNEPLNTVMRDFLWRITPGHAHKILLSCYKHGEGVELPYQDN